jgi:hypothetical protein
MGLLDAVRDLALAARDAGTSFVVERAVASRLQPYGRMLNLSIDSKTKKIRLEILLKGESEPVQITVNEYQITSAGGADFFVIKEASASREWINALLQDFAIDRKVPLPEKYGNVVKSVL